MNTDTALDTVGVLLLEHAAEIRSGWDACLEATSPRKSAERAGRRRAQCQALLSALTRALRAGASHDIEQARWQETRTVLAELAVARAQEGSTPLDTATFILSLKQTLFDALDRAHAGKPDMLGQCSWAMSTLVDSLALHTLDAFQRDRDRMIVRQRMELLELSTPSQGLISGEHASPAHRFTTTLAFPARPCGSTRRNAAIRLRWVPAR